MLAAAMMTAAKSVSVRLSWRDAILRKSLSRQIMRSMVLRPQ